MKPLDQRVRNPDFLIKHLRRVIRVREDIRAVEVDLDFVYLVQRGGGRLRVPAEQHRIGHNTDHKRDPRRRECEKPHREAVKLLNLHRKYFRIFAALNRADNCRKIR